MIIVWKFKQIFPKQMWVDLSFLQSLDLKWALFNLACPISEAILQGKIDQRTTDWISVDNYLPIFVVLGIAETGIFKISLSIFSYSFFAVDELPPVDRRCTRLAAELHFWPS